MIPVLSIIVPAYNVEDYLDRCLASIKKQSYQNYECIVVDDGSPDRCGEIADRYHEEDTRFLVIHQENAGLSDARNNAMKIVKGKIVAFVDGDDWILPNMFETMIRLMEKHDADIVMCDYISERGSSIKNMNQSSTIAEYDGRYFTEKILTDSIGSQLWKFIYRKELWDGIESPRRRHAQDMMIMHQVTNKARVIVVTTEQLYGYNDTREDSISNSKSNAIKNYLDRALAFWGRVDFCIENGFSSDVKNGVVNQALSFAMYAFSDKVIFEDRFSDDVDTIKSYFNKYWKDIRACSNRKDYVVRSWLLKKNAKLYTSLYCCLKRIRSK